MKFSGFSLLKRLQNTYILSKNIHIAKNNFSFMFTTGKNSYGFLVYQEISTTRNFQAQSRTKSLLNLYCPCIKLNIPFQHLSKLRICPCPSRLDWIFYKEYQFFWCKRTLTYPLQLLCDCMFAIYGVWKK